MLTSPAANSNVQTVDGGESYDKLVQAVVENCATIDEAVEQVRAMVRQTVFHRANMLVATPGVVAALEIRDHHVEVERNSTFVARANHHVCLGATPDDDDPDTSVFRLEKAVEMLGSVRRLEDVFPILRIHHPDAGYGICNHGVYETVYSYVVHWRDGLVTLYALQGHPCDVRDFVAMPIRLGEPNDLSVYPSKRAHELPG